MLPLANQRLYLPYQEHAKRFYGNDLVTIWSAGESALLEIACTEGNTEAVLDLIRLGLDVNTRMSSGLSPLAVAIKHGSVAVAQVLIDAGALPKDDLDIVAACFRYLESRYSFHGFRCSLQPFLSMLYRLYPGIVEKQTRGIGTLLHAVARRGTAQDCVFLLQHGANPGKVDGQCMTPVEWAYHEKNWDVLWESVVRGSRLSREWRFRRVWPEFDAADMDRYDDYVRHAESCGDTCKEAVLAILTLSKRRGQINGNGRDVLRLVAKCVWAHRMNKAWPEKTRWMPRQKTIRRCMSTVSFMTALVGSVLAVAGFVIVWRMGMNPR